MAFGEDDNDYPGKPVEEGKTYEVAIDDVGSKGDGIARVEGFVVFVPETDIGERVEVKINSVGRKFAFGEVVERLGTTDGEETEEAYEEEAEEILEEGDEDAEEEDVAFDAEEAAEVDEEPAAEDGFEDEEGMFEEPVEEEPADEDAEDEFDEELDAAEEEDLDTEADEDLELEEDLEEGDEDEAAL